MTRVQLATMPISSADLPASVETDIGAGGAIPADSTGIIDGQAMVYNAASGKWLPATPVGTELAYAEITAPVTLGTVPETAISGLSITVPATAKPLSIELFIPGFSVTGISSQGSGSGKGLAVIQAFLYDGTDEMFPYFTQTPFPAVSTSMALGPLKMRRRLASLAASTTFSLQCNYSSTCGITAAPTLEAGTGSGSAVLPAFIRATTP
jgi:hypothetical protein